jgi:hypothetical protein
MRQGDRATAVKTLQQAHAPDSGSDARDPWWTYSNSPGRDSVRLLADARSRLAARHGEVRQ